MARNSLSFTMRLLLPAIVEVCCHNAPGRNRRLPLPGAMHCSDALSSLDHDECVVFRNLVNKLQPDDMHIFATSAFAEGSEPLMLLVEKLLHIRTKSFASIQSHFQPPMNAPPPAFLHGLVGNNV